MEKSLKRKTTATDPDRTDQSQKRSKTKKQWHKSNQHDKHTNYATAIHAGDAGIWATCPRTREGKCVVELRDLFDEYTKLLYRHDLTAKDLEDDVNNVEDAVEAEIRNLQKPSSGQLFTPVKLDIQCVVFFRTIGPVEPVSLVQRICEDAAHGKLPVRTRYTQRLTPMSMMGHASAASLEKVASPVLATSFHGKPMKYAIRTNMRNHNVLKREAVIDQIASLVGPAHTVDLRHYDLLILVETYKNICGISVVTNCFETLKRFNLVELTQIDQDPQPISTT